MHPSFMEPVGLLAAIACLVGLLAAFARLNASARAAWVFSAPEQPASAPEVPRSLEPVEALSLEQPSRPLPPNGDGPDLALRRQRHIRLLLDLRRDLRVRGYRPPLERRPGVIVACCRFPDRARQ